MRLGRGFVTGMLQGYALGDRMVRDWQDASDRAGLADVMAKIQPTEVTSGEEAMANFRQNYSPEPNGGKTADEFIAENPATFAALEERGHGYHVTGDGRPTNFPTREAAEAAVPSMRAKAAADYWAQKGDARQSGLALAQAVQHRVNELRVKSMQRQEEAAQRQATGEEGAANWMRFGNDLTAARQSGALGQAMQDLTQRQAAGEITPEQAQGARVAYGQLNTPAIARNIQAELTAGGDPRGGMALGQAYAKQAKSALMDEAGRLIGAGDYHGLAKFFSDEGTYGNGRQYHFVGTGQDRAGNEVVTFQETTPDGKVTGARTVRTDDLPGLLEATIDGSKGIEWYRARLASQRAEERARHNQATEDLGAQREERLSARSGSAGQLTLGQQNTNAQIDASRRKLAGMTPEEIKRRTQRTSDTGRENPDFDPMLAQHLRFAAKRKYGNDSWFDEQNAGQASPAPQQAAKPAFSREEVDAALKAGADRAKVADRIKSLGGNPADYGL